MKAPTKVELYEMLEALLKLVKSQVPRGQAGPYLLINAAEELLADAGRLKECEDYLEGCVCTGCIATADRSVGGRRRKSK